MGIIAVTPDIDEPVDDKNRPFKENVNKSLTDVYIVTKHLLFPLLDILRYLSGDCST
jgi:hypothetical protein